MDAVHLMRFFTGRDLIMKVEGGYHGHHDSVQVSVMPDPEEAGGVAAQEAVAPEAQGGWASQDPPFTLIAKQPWRCRSCLSTCTQRCDSPICASVLCRVGDASRFPDGKR